MKRGAFLSRDLIQIRKDVPIDFNLEKCQWKNHNKEKVIQSLRNLGFRSLINRLPSFEKSEQSDKIKEEKVDCQRKLF